MKPPKLSSASVLLALSLGASAGAQQLRANEGPGVKLGEGLVAHPGVAVETAYDTNLFYVDTDEADPLQAAPYLRLVPNFAVATLPPQRGGGHESLQFRLGALLGLRRYLTDEPGTQNLNSFDAKGDLGLTINPKGAVAFGVYDRFARAVQSIGDTSEPNTRDTNTAGVDLRFQPGGRALQTTLGYSYDLSIFEEQAPGAINSNSAYHRGSLAVRWQFLPKTAWLLEGEGRKYQKDAKPVFFDSTHARAYLGMTGLLTPRFSTTLKAGYGFANYEGPREDFSNLIAVTSFSWHLRPEGKFTLAYERDFADSTFSNWYLDDYVYAQFEYTVAKSVILGIKPGYRNRKFGGIPPFDINNDVNPAGDGDQVTYLDLERTDHLLELDSSVDFRVADWLFFGVAYLLQTNTNDFATQSVTGEGIGPVQATESYVKHIVTGRVEVAY